MYAYQVAVCSVEENYIRQKYQQAWKSHQQQQQQKKHFKKEKKYLGFLEDLYDTTLFQ